MKLTRVTRAVLMGIVTMPILGALSACDTNDNPACGGPAGPQYAAADMCVPPPDCEDCGSIWGDPHLITFDGRKYNMMSVGEFTGVATPATEFQFRFAPYGQSRSVSILSGVAVNYGDTTVTVTITPPELSEPVVRLDGEIVTPTTDGVFARGGVIGLGPDGEYVIAAPDGSKAVVRSFGLRLEVDIDAIGTASGLMGNRDGDPENDFVTRDGRDLGPAPEPAVIHADFADSWRLNDDTSRFWYADGESTATYTDLGFPYEPLTLDTLDPQARAEAEQLCREVGVSDPDILDACILDVAVTGDPSYATSAAAVQRRRGLGPEASSSLNPDAAVSWMAQPDGLEALETPVVTTTADAVYVIGRTAEGEAVVVALDGQTGEERWRATGVAPRCGLTDIGDQKLVVVGEADGALAVDGLPSIVVLDALTGVAEHAAAWERKPNLTYCSAPVVSDSKVVIPNTLGELTAWSVDGEPTLTWHRDGFDKLGTDLLAINDSVLATHRGPRGNFEAMLLDAADGTTTATAQIGGAGYPGGSYLVQSGDVAVMSMRGSASADRPGIVSGLSVAGADLTRVWEVDLSASGFGGQFSALSADDEHIYGHVDNTILAFNQDGSTPWTLSDIGWRTTKSSAAPIGRSIFDTTFNGAAVIEARDGEVVREIGVEELFGVDTGITHPSRLEPAARGELLYLAERGDQMVIASIDVG